MVLIKRSGILNKLANQKGTHVSKRNLCRCTHLQLCKLLSLVASILRINELSEKQLAKLETLRKEKGDRECQRE